MSIPLNRLINVNPSVIKAAGNAVDLNGVILSDNPYLPVGTALPFAAADTVQSKFGSTSEEYKAASVYFLGYNGSTIKPAKLYFARFNLEASNAAIIGNNTNLTLSQLKALSGDLTLVVNGESSTQTINFANVTSFTEAANLIAEAFETVDCKYNALTKQFKIAVIGETAENTEIETATGSLAGSLALSSATGALVSIGSQATNATDFFTDLLATTANWYSFTTLFEASDDLHLDLASWTSAQNSRYTYVMWTSSGTALVSGSSETILAKVNEANYASITPVYSKSFVNVMSALGYFASLNFEQVNGRVGLHYRTISGLTPEVTTAKEYDALNDNGYNFYGGYAANANSFAIWQPGRVTGDFMWVDAHAGQAWLNANVQLTIVTTLMGNSNIPYNTAGREMFASPIVTPLERFKAWGGCSAGTDLDENQIVQIKSLLGFDGSQGLIAKGYLIYVGEFNSTMRANRTSPPCYVLYADGGAFRTINLNSIEVQ